MELAYISFRQILTMVILMTIGVVCAKVKWIDSETNKRLSTLLLFLVNPMVLFLSFQKPFEEELLHGLMVSLMLSIISYFIAIALAHLIYWNRNGKTFEIEKFGSVYSNSGFIGIPLIYGIFGSEGVFYLTAYLMMFTLFSWTHGLIVMSGKKDFSSMKKALVSPPLIGVFSGFIFFVLGIRIPDTVEAPLRFISYMNTPLAMLIAGASITTANVLGIFKDIRIYKLCFVRLLVIPLVVIFAFSFWDINPIVLGVVVIATSCPLAASVFLFAYRYDRDYQYASQAFTASIILSMATIPLLMLLL